MSEIKLRGLRERALAGLAAALLLGALLAAYANHFQNSLHFDDAHTIVNNAAIRELRNIPLFFRDATTFSSLPSNQSYRPLVSTLLAIDYKLGGGLHPFWFHKDHDSLRRLSPEWQISSTPGRFGFNLPKRVDWHSVLVRRKRHAR